MLPHISKDEIKKKHRIFFNLYGFKRMLTYISKDEIKKTQKIEKKEHE